MDRMTRIEQKEVLIELLRYFDDKCRTHQIEYSMFSGSLIGAIRHKGMIPWDDDIDVIVMLKDYDKIKDIFQDADCPYKLYSADTIDGYFNPYLKLVDTRTRVVETEMVSRVENMGLFIDIFAYTFIPENSVLRRLKYNLINIIDKCMYITKPDRSLPIHKRIIRSSKNWVNKIVGYRKLLKLHDLLFRTERTNGTFVMYNWPVYGYEKDIQRTENITEYVDGEFEGVNVRIFKNYDKVLKTTFGDFMALPPVEKRRNHNIEAYRLTD